MEAAEDHPVREALCVETREGSGERDHVHVTAVMARDTGGLEARRWSAVELVEAMRAGQRFGVGEAAGGWATLRPAVCGRCPMLTIVSDPPEALARIQACGDDD